MSGSRLHTVRGARRAGFKKALLALLFVPLACVAESLQDGSSATSRLSFTVVVPPVFRVLQISPLRDGHEYRVWTNIRSIVINGHEYRFRHVGETTLKVPASPQGMFVVHGL